MRHVSKIWFQPGMTLEEAYKAVRTIPIDAEYGIENPTQPEQRGWENFSRGDTFIQIRMRELFEGYEVAHEDPYFIGLMGQGGFERDFLLWHDAQLREELLWPLFSLEGTQEVSFANREKYGSGWAAPLIALEKEDLIDRDRLLDEMLKALNRGFPAYRVRWFTQHYEDFNPTEAETTARQHLLIAAMGSGVASTTTFGVKQLSRLSQLDEDGFVAAAAHALGWAKVACGDSAENAGQDCGPARRPRRRCCGRGGYRPLPFARRGGAPQRGAPPRLGQERAYRRRPGDAVPRNGARVAGPPRDR